MKFVSFNVNGLRSRLHQLEAVVEKHRPDVIGIQETKVADADFPLAAVEKLGYQVAYHGQKTHYGVALLSLSPPTEVRCGFPDDSDEAQKRLISATFEIPSGEKIEVINGYFPQGENRDHPVKFPGKRKFYADLRAYLAARSDKENHFVVMGDFNVAPVDEDIGIGEENARRWLRTGKTCFLPEEREWFADLIALGLKDSYRELCPQVNDRFSWFDYRSRGFEREPRRGLRIDHILLSPKLMARCREAGIDYEIRSMTKPSDHCPVWAVVDDAPA